MFGLTIRMRILAVDYGERRLGFAVSDPDGTISMPLRVVEVRSVKNALEETRQICEETEAEKVVVGLPLNMDGTSGEMAQRVEAFVAGLTELVDIPVETWDERLSTVAAERVLLEGDMSRKKRKGLRDQLAAQIFLQGYLDHESAKR